MVRSMFFFFRRRKLSLIAEPKCSWKIIGEFFTMTWMTCTPDQVWYSLCNDYNEMNIMILLCIIHTVCNNINLLLIIILIKITITIITILIIITSSNNDDNNNNNTNNHNNDNNILYNEYLHLHTNMYIVIILWLGIDEIVLDLSTRQSVSQSSESVGTNGRICKPFNLRL